MAGEIAARRHAQAVFEIAVEQNELDKWRSDMNFVADVFGDAELLSVLENPKIRFEDKADVVAKNLTGISAMALNLAKLLVQKHRVKIMPQIALEYSILVDRHQGIEHAQVTTAVEMDFSAESKLKEELSKITGSKVELTTKIDPAIIGGFVARMGDKVIDGSVRNRLQHLKQNIAQAV
ncbi:MAG: ATP synthase F1 subunit delta [Chloroflexota bacterium]|nr:ATP synthase F1 subunit delta [Chloroflexota bacterium]